MIALGHNDWFCTNLDETVGVSLDQIENNFKVWFNIDHNIPSLTLDAAADYTAKIIEQRFQNLHLALSGGLDSEYVAKVLLRNKIKFTAVIIKTNDDYEFWYAEKFCQENNIKPIIIDLSADAVEILKLFYKHALILKKPLSIGLSTSILADLLPIDASIITGYGEPFYNSSNFVEPMGNMLEICDHDFYLNFEYKNKHPSSFFNYTPELFLSMIENIDTSLNTQIAKANLYKVLPRAKSNLNLDAYKYLVYTGYDRAKIVLEQINKQAIDCANTGKSKYFINKIDCINQLKNKY